MKSSTPFQTPGKSLSLVRGLLLGTLLSATSGLGCASETSEEVVAGDESVAEGSDQALAVTRTVGDKLRATIPLNLRSAPAFDAPVHVTMPFASTMTLREAAPQNGFYAVTYGQTEGWASAVFLVSDAPTNPVISVRIEGPRVRAHVQRAADTLCAVAGGCRFPIGTRNDHQPTADRAIDMMQGTIGRQPDAAGVRRGAMIANYATSNSGLLGVEYVIWQQRISYGTGRGWAGMSNRGSITENHFDHVHVAFRP